MFMQRAFGSRLQAPVVVICAMVAGCGDPGAGTVEPPPETPEAPAPSTPTEEHPTEEPEPGVVCAFEDGMIAAAEDAPFGLVRGEAHVWWTAVAPAGGRTLRRLGPGEAEPQTAHTRSTGMFAVHAHGERAYFTDSTTGGVYSWAPGEGERRIAAGFSGLDEAAFAVVDDAVWVLEHGSAPSGFEHRLHRIPLDGGEAQLRAVVDVGPVDGDLNHPMRAGVQGLYWTTVNGRLLRADRETGAVEQVLDIEEGIRAWTVWPHSAGDGIAFVRWTPLTQLEVLLPGEEAPTVVVPDAASGRAVHVHGDTLVWPRSDGLYGVDLTTPGSPPVLLARADTGSVTEILTVDDGILWANTATAAFGGGIGHQCLDEHHAERALDATLESRDTPLRVGDQSIVLLLLQDGGPLHGADVIVSTWMPAHGHGGSPATAASELGEGRYMAEVTFTMAGRWDIRIEADGTHATVEVEIEDAR